MVTGLCTVVQYLPRLKCFNAKCRGCKIVLLAGFRLEAFRNRNQIDAMPIGEIAGDGILEPLVSKSIQ